VFGTTVKNYQLTKATTAKDPHIGNQNGVLQPKYSRNPESYRRLCSGMPAKSENTNAVVAVERNRLYFRRRNFAGNVACNAL
jgi:hypothetical protein